MPPSTVVLEKGDKLYLVGPVAPFEPGDGEVDELAFAQQLRKGAPNPNLLWMRGSYVESENPNANGAKWTRDELALKSLTPVYMPVTVMHDPRTAVGMIADTALVERDEQAPKPARIDNTLAIWKHRFQDVAEEAMDNYRQGTLAQSMECTKAWYECDDCGLRFPNLAGAEKANWCEHLRGETGRAVRTLGNVTFTGTGLIFGSRGGRAAYSEADLEVLTDEVAEMHEKAQERPTRPRSHKRMDTIEIPRTEYTDLQQKAARVDDAERKATEAQEAAAKVPELEGKVTQLETDKAAAETAKAEAEKKVTGFEEKERTTELAKTRLDALGPGFTAKLATLPATKARLEERAGTLKDEEWESELAMIEETAGVKRDAQAEGEPAGGSGGSDPAPDAGGDAASRSNFGGGAPSGGNGGVPSREQTRSVVGGLATALTGGKKQS